MKLELDLRQNKSTITLSILLFYSLAIIFMIDPGMSSYDFLMIMSIIYLIGKIGYESS